MKFLNSIYEKKILFFLCISFLLYGNTLKNGYALDDQFVTENSYTNKGLKTIKKIFTSYYAESDGKNNYEYRPIVKLSFALEHELFGVRPWVGHLINILLYAICLLLLYKVLLLIFHQQTSTFNLLIVLLFAVLPIHTEVVASLKNRDVLLCFLFCMQIIIQLDKFFKTNNYIYLVYAIVLGVLGLLTKRDILPYLAITPLILYKKHKFKIAPFIITTIVFISALILSKAIKDQFLDKTLSERIYKYHENPLFFDHLFSSKLSTAFNALGFYLKMLILPNNMSCYYGHQTLDIFNYLSIYSILGIVLFILLVFYFFKLIKTENPIWYAVVFFGIAISMYLNIVKVVPGIVGDRFVFSASIGFSILIVYLLLFYINKNLKINSLKEVNLNFKISFALLCLVYSIITIQRNSEWKDRFTLYSHDVVKWPESAALNILYSNIILVNLNYPNTFLTDQNKNNYITKAAESLNNVLKVDSLNTTALNNIGFIKQKIYNDYAAAIPYYMKSLSVDSTKFEVQLNLCQCLLKTSNYPLAQSLVLKLFTDNPKNQEVLDLMGNILIENKKIKEGIQIFNALSDEQPNNNNINIILGNFYIADYDSINAKTYYTKALENDKNNPKLIKIIATLSE